MQDDATSPRSSDCRFRARDLLEFATSVLTCSGLAGDRAEVVARVLLTADLLGFGTHGLSRLRFNAEALRSGATRAAGDPIVLQDHGAASSWDANMLPGPWVVHQALLEAKARADEFGVGVATIRRAQHIACLAAYLPELVEAGYAVLIAASSPNERVVVSAEGVLPVLSNNPIAFGAPADPVPLLLDVSMASTTVGSVARAHRDGKRLPAPLLRLPTGELSNDPAKLFDRTAAGILPFGGSDGGYKGYILGLLIEVLTAGFNNYQTRNIAGEEEANAVFLQVFDPDALGSRHGLRQFIRAFRETLHEDPARASRLPGEKAWKHMMACDKHGVPLGRHILDDLRHLGEVLGLDVPSPVWGGDKSAVAQIRRGNVDREPRSG